MKKKFVIVSTIGAFVVAFILLLDSGLWAEIRSKFIRLQSPEITQHFYDTLASHLETDSEVVDGSIIFIGDSITEGLRVSDVISPSVNYGIGTDTSYGVLQRLPKYTSLERAGAVVLAIGINDMKHRSNDKILTHYHAILEKLPKRIPVIISAVLPLDEAERSEWKERNLKRIKPLNLELKRLAEKTRNVFFLDAGSLLRDESGNMADIFHRGDGIHLSQRGYEIWGKVLSAGISDALSR